MGLQFALVLPHDVRNPALDRNIGREGWSRACLARLRSCANGQIEIIKLHQGRFRFGYFLKVYPRKSLVYLSPQYADLQGGRMSLNCASRMTPCVSFSCLARSRSCLLVSTFSQELTRRDYRPSQGTGKPTRGTKPHLVAMNHRRTRV